MAVESYSVYTSVSFSFVRFSVLLLIAKLSHPHLWTQYHFTIRLQFIISSTLDEHSVVSSLGLSPLNIFVCVQFCWVGYTPGITHCVRVEQPHKTSWLMFLFSSVKKLLSNNDGISTLTVWKDSSNALSFGCFLQLLSFSSAVFSFSLVCSYQQFYVVRFTS